MSTKAARQPQFETVQLRLERWNDSATTLKRAAPWFAAAKVMLVVGLIFGPLAFGAVQAWASASLTVIAVLLLIFWAFGCVRERVVRFAWNPIYGPGLLFLAAVTVQAVTARTADSIATRDALILYCTYFIAFAMAATLLDDGIAELFAIIVVTYTLLLSVFAIVQFFTSPEKIFWIVVPRWGGYIFGPYVNRNHYAGLIDRK